jgi:hypothetical protein
MAWWLQPGYSLTSMLHGAQIESLRFGVKNDVLHPSGIDSLSSFLYTRTKLTLLSLNVSVLVIPSKSVTKLTRWYKYEWVALKWSQYSVVIPVNSKRAYGRVGRMQQHAVDIFISWPPYPRKGEDSAGLRTSLDTMEQKKKKLLLLMGTEPDRSIVCPFPLLEDPF